MLKQLVAQSAQFIIATHSPIILAYPDATIYNFDCTPIAPTLYADLEHVRFTKQFLQQPNDS
jgi:predicted ATPase